MQARAIVTGGLGFIGSNLIKLLLKNNFFVINIDKISYASNFYNLKNIKKIANTGVDFISVGNITHSAKSIDITLKIE